MATALSRGQRGAQLGRLHDQAMASAARTVQRAAWLRAAAPGLDPARLTVSLGESLVFRAVAKPVTFTLKIWGAWQLVLLGKRVQLERRQRQHQLRGTEP